MDFLKNLFKPKANFTGSVFIIEDNKVYAETLKAFLLAELEEQIQEIKVFPVGETALLEIDKKPDVVIIDYFLDSKYFDAETGLEIVKQIRENHPEMNIIVLSSQQEIDVVIDAMKKYNCSYVKKDERAFGNVIDLVTEIYQMQ